MFAHIILPEAVAPFCPVNIMTHHSHNQHLATSRRPRRRYGMGIFFCGFKRTHTHPHTHLPAARQTAQRANPEGEFDTLWWQKRNGSPKEAKRKHSGVGSCAPHYEQQRQPNWTMSLNFALWPCTDLTHIYRYMYKRIESYVFWIVFVTYSLTLTRSKTLWHFICFHTVPVNKTNHSMFVNICFSDRMHLVGFEKTIVITIPRFTEWYWPKCKIILAQSPKTILINLFKIWSNINVYTFIFN